MTLTATHTIREIVAEDFRAAAVFERHGIDFCCRGGRLVEDACREQGVDPAALFRDLTAACASDQPGAPRFASWDLDTLMAYIVGNHHSYVRQALPVLLAHTQKVARVHGDRHPEVVEIAGLFAAVAEEMTSHMAKEEQILFPYVATLAAAQRQGHPVARPPFGTVDNPIRMMELEHESAGDAMARIRELSGGFQPPDDACTTFQVCYQELKAFELDLHNHVHLENNILFPRAQRLEVSL